MSRRSVEIPLGPGRRTLRVTLTTDERGEREALVLASGFGTGDGFRRPYWAGQPLSIGAHTLFALRAALASLDESGPVPPQQEAIARIDSGDAESSERSSAARTMRALAAQ